MQGELLKQIDLSSNYITNLDPNIFIGLDSLNFVDLTINHFNGINLNDLKLNNDVVVNF